MSLRQRKRITVDAQSEGELEERLEVLLDAITAHGAEILGIYRVATLPRAQVLYETVMPGGRFRA